MNDGQWHHVAAVRSVGPSAKLQLFVDGVLDAETSIGNSSSNFYGLPQAAAIGRDGFACDGAIPSMNGKLAGVALFGKALTGQQVASHARVGAPDWSKWTVGDVHAHAAGDTSLVIHPSCGGLATPIGASPCADLLVSYVAAHAGRFDTDWLILTEHAPWLGF